MNTKAIGTRFEKIIARDLEGSIRPGSGCLPFAKADVITPLFLVECKASETGKIFVKLDWIRTIKEYARQENLTWALAVSPSSKTGNYFVIVDEKISPCYVRATCMNQKGLTIYDKTCGATVSIDNEIGHISILTREDILLLNSKLLEDKLCTGRLKSELSPQQLSGSIRNSRSWEKPGSSSNRRLGGSRLRNRNSWGRTSTS